MSPSRAPASCPAALEEVGQPERQGRATPIEPKHIEEGRVPPGNKGLVEFVRQRIQDCQEPPEPWTPPSSQEGAPEEQCQHRITEHMAAFLHEIVHGAEARNGAPR